MGWPTKPRTVGELVPEAVKDSKAFVGANPDPVLLVVGYEFGTESVSGERTLRAGDMSSGEIRGLNAAYVLPVKKVRSLGTDRILVGRGRENDVVLPFKSVSRLHAFFRLGADGLWTVEDAGSAFGTFVRGARINAGMVRALGQDTPLRFGGVEGSFQTAEGLAEFLLKLAQVTR